MHFPRLLQRLALAACAPQAGLLSSASLVAAALLATPVLCLAQASSGVTGTVTDPSGAIVPGAAVVITNVGTQTTINLVTSSSGTYAATGLVPGRYKIEVTAPGFTRAVRTDVNIEVTVQATIDIKLASGESSQTVEVTADLISLNTTQPELGTTIEPAVVASLPVAIGGGRGRQIDSLQFLAPGIQGDQFSHRVNGGVDFQQEILFNGVPAPQAETEGFSQLVNPPFELVNQFRLERSTFSAKYGLAQGAITYQTVSGTNTYHGDAFYINRNEFFDARGYFNDRTPTDRENNYGFTISGPLSIPHFYNAKDRTFFALALDFASTKLTDTTRGTVPTALEKTGDFSDFKDADGNLIAIFDPQTGQQFQYQGRPNVIDPRRISAASASLIPFIPDPDPGFSGPSNKNRVYAPNAYPTINHQIGFTVDHNLTSKQSLHYAQWRNPFSSTAIDGSKIFLPDNPLQATKFQPNLGTGYLLNYVNALSPTLVFTGGFSWIGEINNQFTNSPVVNFAGVAPSPISQGLLPHITFDGQYATDQFGVSSGETNSVNRKLGLSGVTNFLWTKGRHTFNIGGEFRRTYQDDNECQRCTGELNFSQKSTADPNNQGSTGSSFASFLLGQVDNANRIFANELRLRNLLIAPYFQDDIKITPKLTVNFGLRWDIMMPFKENDNQIVFLNPGAPNPVAGGLPGAAQRFSNLSGGVDRADIHFNNIGPRIGFAYAVNDKTVIQAGYNIVYLNGGSYEFGTSKVATTYGNLLQGSFIANSTGGTAPGYGSYDLRPLPAPAAAQIGSPLGIGTEIRAFDPKRSGSPPYLQQWNFNVQRQLPWNTFLQVAYVGNHALHLNGYLNPISQGDPSVLLPYGSLLSQPADSPAAVAAGIKLPYGNFVNDLGGTATVAHALSPFPQYSNVHNNYDLTGAANYNGLQASLEKRFSNGLSFLTSYTLSKTLSNADTGFNTFAGNPENKYNQFPEYTVSNNDVRNLAKVSGTYELPIGPGKRFVNNKGIAGQILGGVQLGFILQYSTGTPFGVSENDNPLGCSGCFNRPSFVPGVKRFTTDYKNLGFDKGTGGVHPGQSTRRVIPNNAFDSTTGTFVLGNALRNITEFRNPGFYQEDLKASKKFALGERVSLQLEMNYFNLLNRTRFSNAGDNSNVDNSSNFGLINAGQQNSPRQGQISGRISF